MRVRESIFKMYTRYRLLSIHIPLVLFTTCGSSSTLYIFSQPFFFLFKKGDIIDWAIRHLRSIQIKIFPLFRLRDPISALFASPIDIFEPLQNLSTYENGFQEKGNKRLCGFPGFIQQVNSGRGKGASVCFTVSESRRRPPHRKLNLVWKAWKWTSEREIGGQ